MLYKKTLFIPFVFTLLSSFSMATIYQSGKSASTENWSVHDNNPPGATITSEPIADMNGYAYTLVFKGDKRRNSYIIGSKRSSTGWNNTKESILNWTMKFSEKFKITLYTQTTKGLRIFYYDYKNSDKGLYKKKYIRIGLGKKSIDGTVNNFTRNIKSDLKKYDPDNRLLSINGFKIQGSGEIYKLSLTSNENPEDKALIKKVKEYCLNKKTSNLEILCSEDEKNIAYVIDNTTDNFAKLFYTFYKVSIEPNEEFVKLLDAPKKSDFQPQKDMHFNFIKALENTPIYATYTRTQEADEHGREKFYYKDKVILSFGYFENNGKLSNVHIFENGKKLSLEYLYYPEFEWSNKEGNFKEIYDISNPAEPKLISKVNTPF